MNKKVLKVYNECTPELKTFIDNLKAHFESGSPYIDVHLFNLTLNYDLLE